MYTLFLRLSQRVALQKDNFRRLLRTVEALSDLGPEMTAEREFPQTARAMLSASFEAGGAREGAIFTYSDRPSLLTSSRRRRVHLNARTAVIPLLPRHVHALTSSREPVILDSSFLRRLSKREWKCCARTLQMHCSALKVGAKLVGIIALGRRDGDGLYDSSDLEALELLCITWLSPSTIIR